MRKKKEKKKRKSLLEILLDLLLHIIDFILEMFRKKSENPATFLYFSSSKRKKEFVCRKES